LVARWKETRNANFCGEHGSTRSALVPERSLPERLDHVVRTLKYWAQFAALDATYRFGARVAIPANR